MTKDPYEVLGVSRSASADEIKKAYRKKARENHPDLHPDDPQASEKLKEINEAYDRITNPEKYRASDARAAAAQGAASGTGYYNPFAGYGYGGYGAGGSGYGGYGAGGSGYGTGGSSQAGGSGSGQGQGAQGNPYSNPYGGSGYGGGFSYGGPFGWTVIDFDDLFGFGGAGFGGQIHPEANASDSMEFRSAITEMNAGRYAQAVRTLDSVPSTGRNARWYYLSAIANRGAGNTVTAADHIKKAVQKDPTNADYQRAQAQFQQAGKTYTQQSQTRGFNPLSGGCLDGLGCCLGVWCCAPAFMRFCIGF